MEKWFAQVLNYDMQMVFGGQYTQDSRQGLWKRYPFCLWIIQRDSQSRIVRLFNLILTLFVIAPKKSVSFPVHPSVPWTQAWTHTDWQGGTQTYCGPTSGEATARKASGDGLIDPLVKMGDIPPTSISIKPLRLEASQGLLLFLFRGELRKIYSQLMVSGRKALLEYIKSTYRGRGRFALWIRLSLLQV